jgi:hypothetical protein
MGICVMKWLMRLLGWEEVSFASDCIGDDGDICSLCGGEYTECDCPGPTQDGYRYIVLWDMVYAKKVL